MTKRSVASNRPRAHPPAPTCRVIGWRFAANLADRFRIASPKERKQEADARHMKPLMAPDVDLNRERKGGERDATRPSTNMPIGRDRLFTA
jgi:hypothetical protein